MNPILWALPVYVANSSATLSRLLPGTHPIDFGKKFFDGRRILGDGKTFEGLAIGIVAGSLVGRLVYPPFHDPLPFVVLALLGDMAGSFVKRRAGLKRGEEAPILDQLDFLLFSYLARPPIDPVSAFLLLPFTYFLHRLGNFVAYIIYLKKEPW